MPRPTCPTSLGLRLSVTSYCLTSPWSQLLKYRYLSSSDIRMSVIRPDSEQSENTFYLTHATPFEYSDFWRPTNVIIRLGKKGRKEMFYLTTHSTHFIYGYMASDIRLQIRKQRRSKWVDNVQGLPRGSTTPPPPPPNQNEPQKQQPLVWGPFIVPCPWASEGLATPV